MKIKQIEIKNFQSHKNTKIDLSENINLFIGTSTHGKSAIIRALLWVITNRPIGTSFISYWNENEDTSVKIILSNENTIERKKSKHFNGYIINENIELEALRADVPEQVQKLFNLADYNIQQQFDSPFLLSDSSGQVAQFLNKVIKIDDIDKILKLAEQKKRKTKTDLTYLSESIEQNKIKLKNLSWVDLVEMDIMKAEELSTSIDKDIIKLDNIKCLCLDYKEKKDLYREIDFNKLRIDFDLASTITDDLYKNKVKKEKIEILIKNYKEKEKEIKNYPEELPQLFNTTAILFNEKIENENKLRTIKRLLQDYKEREEFIKNCPADLSNLFSEYEKLNEQVEVKLNDIKIIRRLLKSYYLIENDIEKNNKELERIEKEMPDLCPLCGSKLKKEGLISGSDLEP